MGERPNRITHQTGAADSHPNWKRKIQQVGLNGAEERFFVKAAKKHHEGMRALLDHMRTTSDESTIRQTGEAIVFDEGRWYHRPVPSIRRNFSEGYILTIMACLLEKGGDKGMASIAKALEGRDIPLDLLRGNVEHAIAAGNGILVETTPAPSREREDHHPGNLQGNPDDREASANDAPDEVDGKGPIVGTGCPPANIDFDPPGEPPKKDCEPTMADALVDLTGTRSETVGDPATEDAENEDTAEDSATEDAEDKGAAEENAPTSPHRNSEDSAGSKEGRFISFLRKYL